MKPGHFCPKEDAPQTQKSWQSQHTPEALGCLKFVPVKENHLGSPLSCESPRPGMEGEGRAQYVADTAWEGGHPSSSSQLIHPSARGQGSAGDTPGNQGSLCSGKHTWFCSCYSWCQPQQMCVHSSGLMHNSRGELLPDR